MEVSDDEATGAEMTKEETEAEEARLYAEEAAKLEAQKKTMMEDQV